LCNENASENRLILANRVGNPLIYAKKARR